MMKRILFISNVPSPYNIEYLNELGKMADVTAVFERGHSSERDTSWKSIHAVCFKYIALNGIHITADTAFSPGVLGYIYSFRHDHIIIGNPLTPTGILSILFCKATRTTFILQSEGGIPKNGKGLKERFKKWLMKSAKLYLSGMNPKTDYFLQYGATEDVIVQYPFTSLYSTDLFQDVLSYSEKVAERNKLGIVSDRLVLCVSRLAYIKGVDVLLKACSGLSNDIHVLIIGGLPNKVYKKIIHELNLQNVHFIDFLSKDDLKKYYRAADLFVLPTRADTWGLVINEAMASGLPVITTNTCVAGCELIEKDINGALVPPEDPDALRDQIEKYIHDDKLLYQMGRNNLRKMDYYTLENMASVIKNAICNLER